MHSLKMKFKKSDNNIKSKTQHIKIYIIQSNTDYTDYQEHDMG